MVHLTILSSALLVSKTISVQNKQRKKKKNEHNGPTEGDYCIRPNVH